MKKIVILLLVALSFGSVVIHAQGVAFDKTASNPTGAISNAGIDTGTIHLTKGYPRLLFSTTYTRSANTAAGTAILEYRIHTSDNWTSDAGDTLTITNAASKTYVWNKTVTARYWRIRVGGATTVTATVVNRVQPVN